jgi:O-methyltransferase
MTEGLMGSTLLQRLRDRLLTPRGRLGDSILRWALGDSVRKQVRLKQAQQRPIVEAARRDHAVLLLASEVTQLIDMVQSVAKVPGDIAEVGVFDGGSAKLIAQIKGDKALHLFDTFTGLPDPSTADESFFRRGQLAPHRNAEQMRAAFSGFDGVHIYPGLFPQETGQHVEHCRFSFVHLDVDLYRSTLDALEFFYPRMNRGGVFVSHDYLTFESVRRAFAEFFEQRPEPVIAGAGSQCLVVRT